MPNPLRLSPFALVALLVGTVSCDDSLTGPSLPKGSEIPWEMMTGRLAYFDRGENAEAVIILDAGPRKIREIAKSEILGISDMTWHPDGDRITFYQVSEEEGRGLYDLDIEEGTIEPILSWPGQRRFPAYSPDGRLAYLFSGQVAGQSYTRVISVQEEVISALPDRCQMTRPAWSPDGESFIAISENNGVFQVDAADGSASQLAISGGVFDATGSLLNPAYAPDGSTIALEAQLLFASRNEIWLVDADGGNPRLLTTGRNPAWSPDSDWIAFVDETEEGGWELALINADGSGRTRITELGVEFAQPSWIE
jgi:Tol biopolymer transport system component